MAVDLATVQSAMAALEAQGLRRSCNSVHRHLKREGFKTDRKKVAVLYRQALLLRWRPPARTPTPAQDTEAHYGSHA